MTVLRVYGGPGPAQVFTAKPLPPSAGLADAAARDALVYGATVAEVLVGAATARDVRRFGIAALDLLFVE